MSTLGIRSLSKALPVRRFLLVALTAASATAAQEPQQVPHLIAHQSDAEVRAYFTEVAKLEEAWREKQVRCREGGATWKVTPNVLDSGAVVTGTVVGTEGRAIKASILPQGYLRATPTDSDGRFYIAIPRDSIREMRSITLRVRAIGYQQLVARLALLPGDSVDARAVMCGSPFRLEEVDTWSLPSLDDITNVQQAGVDEGGIVKRHGDHLVILRRGRLFTLATTPGRMRKVDQINAYGPGIDPRFSWYDEMLISEDRVFVLGYSYALQATEINLFRIDERGHLTYESTWHLRSHDYYSSRNYATRLIGSRLILYSPRYVGSARDPLTLLPQLRRWRGDSSAPFERITTPGRIYRLSGPVRANGLSALHTVTVCDLSIRELDCEASTVVGPPGNVYYVSANAVYVWSNPWPWGRNNGVSPLLFRMPLDGAEPSMIAVHGTPIDQFSFREEQDGALHVLTRSEGWGDGMWGAEFGSGDVVLARVPPEGFHRDVETSGVRYRRLPNVPNGAFQNRYVGDHLLYGVGNGWFSPKPDSAQLQVVPLKSGPVRSVRLPHGVDRIDILGRDAIVIGSDGRDLHFSGIRLALRPYRQQAYRVPDATQGELRSHGFFYRQDSQEDGVLGLPIRAGNAPGYRHILDGSAGVIYLANDGRTFRSLGTLSARENETTDGCKASCVDWYGNARPIFLGDRVFALLGYELVEGKVEAGRIREVARVNFQPTMEHVRK